ncbi:DUF1120 domain-containing protein [Scandinavium sp. H11S7]|uniref:DUF1120 domain-containing protein n=1 Tax=Scandinavium hiltneri TaxID=2926519 RepID=A0ABT2DW03_9ENTR|nr:DUF1120 domain-containing protein [Scandinavium hiltneri]MCS2159798.1 DUF1120 domain-containing protein [Scandinavium hiltneri]
MKKLLLVALIAAATSSAMAAPTTTLQVKGALIMSACVPNLSNGGVVDYGNIGIGGMSATDTNQIGSKDITLTITCDAPSKVAFTMMDDRSDSLHALEVESADGASSTSASAVGFEFGLGKTANNVNIGAYNVRVSNAITDGANAADISKTTSGTWKNGVGFMDSTGGAIATAAATGTLTPVAFTTGVFPMQISAAIQGTDVLAISDDTILDGQATISLVYL